MPSEMIGYSTGKKRSGGIGATAPAAQPVAQSPFPTPQPQYQPPPAYQPPAIDYGKLIQATQQPPPQEFRQRLDISAQMNPQLESLAREHAGVRSDLAKYQGDLESNSGRIADLAVSRIRDLGEGQQKELSSNLASRGLLGSGIETQGRQAIREGVQRSAADQLANIQLGREGLIGQTIANRAQATTSAAQFPKASIDAAMAEKGLGLNAYQTLANQQLQQQSNSFNQLLAVLNAQRGTPGYNTGGGYY